MGSRWWPTEFTFKYVFSVLFTIQEKELNGQNLLIIQGTSRGVHWIIQIQKFLYNNTQVPKFKNYPKFGNVNNSFEFNKWKLDTFTEV